METKVQVKLQIIPEAGSLNLYQQQIIIQRMCILLTVEKTKIKNGTFKKHLTICFSSKLQFIFSRHKDFLQTDISHAPAFST